MTPLYKQMLKELGLDAVYGIDFETYWASDYTLSRLATTDYIYDPRFETQLVAVQKDTWSKPRVMEVRAFREWLRTINWDRNGVLGHHTQFDGLILSHHFKVEPKRYFDTLSMARPVMPINVPRGLDPLAKALKLAGKVHGAALHEIKGIRWKDAPKELKGRLKLYAGDDISDTWAIFFKLLEFTPFDELMLIDQTIGMYAKPRLLLDKTMVEDLVEQEVNRKRKRVEDLSITLGDLTKDTLFAGLLEAAGVDVPMKWSEKQKREVYAFSKQDADFKALLEHEDETVVALVSARLDVKSTMVESRARRLAARADYGAQPIYLNYWGAGTGRWSGGDKCIAGDALISVKRGSHCIQIRLDNLRHDDLVWDGEAYVKHGGLKYQGKKEVISYQGVVATEDHKVFYDKDKPPVRLGEAKRRGLKLVGDYGREGWYALRRKCQVAKDRCCNPRNRAYPNYGGRGITFGFATGSDMAEYVLENLGYRPSKAHSIDRIDNDRGYEPGNLRWATAEQQGQNKREYRGSERLRELCRKRPDLSYETIRTLANRGYSDEMIMAYVKKSGGRPRTATASPRVGDSRHAR